MKAKNLGNTVFILKQSVGRKVWTHLSKFYFAGFLRKEYIREVAVHMQEPVG